VAPYLCYLRQDAVFQKGECFSAKYLGQLLSQYFDHIITVAPHLHRIHDLSEIFSIKTTVVSPKLAIIDYIKAHISHPFLIVPDENMAEWAKELSCPYRIVKKIRHSDREVTVEPLINLNLENRSVVVVDDIVSSGATLENIYKALPVRPERPFAIIIHAIFSKIIYRGLNLLYQKVITTNTTPHPSNLIDLRPQILAAIE
jgi:ribose-phosphate pyrophosphokinase